jgi:hypothetical protein
MSDATDAPPAPLATIAGLKPRWEAFRAGGVALCPRDAAPMALNVDGQTNVYRFVCVSCGNASPWFEAKLQRLAIKGPGGVDLATSDG